GTPVSRPLIEVYSSFPERTSRHTGALLPGWLCARCCWVSPCCPTEVLVDGRTSASATAKERAQTAHGFMSRAPLFRPRVFVLSEIPGPDGGFPALLVAFVPLGAGVRICSRIVLPGLRVGLALVLPLLVDDHLLALAARAETERKE